MIFWQLFYTFFTIGLFGFGGGYGMLSLIQNLIVVKFGWISSSEFTDIVAVSQMTPGPIGINSATYVGYTAVINAGMGKGAAVAGSLLASFSIMLPSFILMLLISMFFMKYSSHPMVKDVLIWLRRVVVGLLAAAVLSLISRENFGTDNIRIAASISIFAASFLLTYRLKWNPILVIVIAGIFGGVFNTLV
ncbi:MAG: chromate transporter [Bacteroidaceae bacterium]|nr:chromate transporter [Bacteroidaceae bacterium]